MSKYNFCGLLTVSLDTGRRSRYKKYFDNEYLRIQRNQGRVKPRTAKSQASVSVRIVERLPAKQPGDIQRNVSFKGLFRYSYLIRGLSGSEVEIFFKDHPISRIYMNAVGVYLQAQVLEPIMYCKLLENDVLLMHAAGVAKNSKGYLMPAHGGTGKTTFSMSLLQHGFKLLGDDLLLVDVSNRLVYPYPRPLHLFTYNINSLRGAHIPLRYRLTIYSKNALRFFLEKILRTDFLISTRVHTDEIFSGELFAPPVSYERIIFLRKTGPAIVLKKIKPSNVGRLALEIIRSADLNKSLYQILGSQSDQIKRVERKVTKKLLLQFSYITYLNTRQLDLNRPDYIQQIFFS